MQHLHQMLAIAYSRRLLNGCGVVVHVTVVSLSGCSDSLSCCLARATGTIDRLTMKSLTQIPPQHTTYKTDVVKIAMSIITTTPSFLDVEPTRAAAVDRWSCGLEAFINDNKFLLPTANYSEFIAIVSPPAHSALRRAWHPAEVWPVQPHRTHRFLDIQMTMKVLVSQ